jgi:poly-beta-1,6-N-acetyl-D-glucosamine synthase
MTVSKNIRYSIISPVRDEAEYVERTIDSVASQTIRPIQWVIVNDGSTDATGRLVEEAATQHAWIKIVHREDHGGRRAGGGVVEAFYAGLEQLEDQRWDYLAKLDGDVTFDPDYFERCFHEFALAPKLGIAGGLICKDAAGMLSAESKGDPAFHVRGATKIYRRECWKELGGLVRSAGWDTIDELKANMLGWSTLTFPDIKIVHHRPAGAAYGAWSNWVKNGRANYVASYHPLFMAVKCISRALRRPYRLEAFGLWMGFCEGYVKKGWRIDDPKLIKYFRGQQLRRLLGRPSLWS